MRVPFAALVALSACRGWAPAFVAAREVRVAPESAALSPQGGEDEPSGGAIKVIGAGLSRTATQSLALALTDLGIKTLHAEGFHPKIPVGRGTKLTSTLTAATQKYFKEGNFQALEPALKLVEELDIRAVVDLPWSECVPDLIRRYPQAKVVVTVRDSAEKWYRSYWEHFRWGAVFPPFLTHPFIAYWRDVTTKTGCGPVTRFPPWRLTEQERADCLSAYDSHVAAIRQVVPPENLLVFNVKEGWKPLCRFLGLPVPTTEFPRHDSYSFLHWRTGAAKFLAVVYTVYAAVLIASGYCFVRTLHRLPRHLELHSLYRKTA